MSKWKKIGFLASYSIPLLILLGFYLPDSPVTMLAGPFAYLVIPAIDLLLGKDQNNVIKEDFDDLVNNAYFDILVYSHVYIQYMLLAWGVYVLSTYELTNRQIIGIIVSQGIYSGTIINVAHELGHRSSKVAIWHARIALISVFYHHFIIEHNRGHHVRVATPEDPATARRGENLYHFYLRTVIGGFLSARTIQKKLTGGNTLWFSPFTLGLLASPVLFFLLYVFSYVLSGEWNLLIPVFLIVQAVLAVLLLEAVNYIEHYGMLRQIKSDGRYERVNSQHSWNANHFFSNLILFNLQRHSDHHAYASRPYQVLRHYEESPQLPFGYPLMIMMALLPPIWFKVMNNRLASWKKNTTAYSG